MAKLIVKQLHNQGVEFACYSERGIMAYFSFRVAANKIEFCRFLRALQFVPSAAHPFQNATGDQLTSLTVFSELEVGQRLGNPDGGFFFFLQGTPYFLWVQCKGNESYNASCINPIHR